MTIISVYITYPDQRIAQAMVELLLNEKLIACGNIFPIVSTYEWQDTIENENEYASILKTTADKWESLVELVEKKHPYSVPCIVKYHVEVNKKYGDWVVSAVN